MTAVTLPRESHEQPALRVFAATLRTWRGSEYPKWIAAADIARNEDGTWSVRVRSLFNGNRWCEWVTVRTPLKVKPGEGWNFESLALARRKVRQAQA
jgi:hypothetical protein